MVWWLFLISGFDDYVFLISGFDDYFLDLKPPMSMDECSSKSKRGSKARIYLSFKKLFNILMCCNICLAMQNMLYLSGNLAKDFFDIFMILCNSSNTTKFNRLR